MLLFSLSDIIDQTVVAVVSAVYNRKGFAIVYIAECKEAMEAKNDETELDAQERAFEKATALFKILPLEEKIPYMNTKIKAIKSELKRI